MQQNSWWWEGGRQTIKFLNLGTEAEKKRVEESVLQTSENQSV